jgi:alkylhydroperoxidase family enzyme
MEAGCRIPLLSLEDSRKAASDLLLALLFRSQLAHRLREFVIMRIGWVTGCDYEWTQHWTIARDTFSLTAEELPGVRDWQNADCFDERDRGG